MKNVKKLTAVLLVVFVVSSAGAALAYGHRRPNTDFRQEFSQPFEREDFRGCRGGMSRRDGRFFEQDMPENIKSKMVEVEKLRIDLRALLSAEKIDKAKALETYEAIQKIENEIKTWRFVNRLEKFEKLSKPQTKAENSQPAE